MSNGERYRYYVKAEPFSMGTEKEEALKPLEEAAEVFGAWQTMNRAKLLPETTKRAVVYECADVIQATCNLLSRLDVAQAELVEAMRLVHENNARRGRYGDGE